jgi:8-oxo-dGTP pyrophosphatase MutT (NUDIX family)
LSDTLKITGNNNYVLQCKSFFENHISRKIKIKILLILLRTSSHYKKPLKIFLDTQPNTNTATLPLLCIAEDSFSLQCNSPPNHPTKFIPKLSFSDAIDQFCSEHQLHHFGHSTENAFSVLWENEEFRCSNIDVLQAITQLNIKRVSDGIVGMNEIFTFDGEHIITFVIRKTVEEYANRTAKGSFQTLKLLQFPSSFERFRRLLLYQTPLPIFPHSFISSFGLFQYSVVAFCICTRFNSQTQLEEILMVEERNGLLFLPAGHVDPNETMIQGIIREVKEEASVRFSPRGISEFVYYCGREWSSIFLVFTGECPPTDTPKIVGDHHSNKAMWLPLCVVLNDLRCEMEKGSFRYRKPKEIFPFLVNFVYQRIKKQIIPLLKEI